MQPEAAAAAFLLASCIVFTLPAYGQAAHAANPGATTPAFEVISIKPAKPDCLGMSIGGSPGRYVARCVTAWGLIYNAYTIQMGEHPPGLPAWADKDKFDVDAKMDDATAAAMQSLARHEVSDQRQLMLRALLADRFGLRVHSETRMEPIDELVIAKGGAKLKVWPAGVQTQGQSWGRSMVRIQGAPTARLAFCLTSVLGRTVVDKTGLTGNFDVDLKWTPDDQQGTPDAGPTLFTALEEQLGLKLVPAKGAVEVFVVDHIERPTPN
jgi:uncharacterized protein (TIGR03435 family)